MLYGLLLVAARRIVTFVATCCTVCYLLPHAVQLRFVAACRTVCYLEPHAIQLLLLPHALQFTICCHMQYNLLLWLLHTVAFVATHCTVAFDCRTPYSLLLVATHRKVTFVAECCCSIVGAKFRREGCGGLS